MLVCPLPEVWNCVFNALKAAADARPCRPASPPIPLILAGWHCSDAAKHRRWLETISWAEENGCPELVRVAPQDFYTASALSEVSGWDYYANFKYGPVGPKPIKPSQEELQAHIRHLRNNWSEIFGASLPSCETCPLRFSGRRARSLIVRYRSSTPSLFPWSMRGTAFSAFRARVNAAIAPHHVDHIDFRPGPHTSLHLRQNLLG